MKQYQPPPELMTALRSLAAEDAAAAPPPELEARLLAEFAAPPPPGSRWWLRALVPVSAAIVIVCAVILQGWNPKPDAARPFVQVPFVVPPAPYERTEVVRQVIPISSLIAAGFEFHVSYAGGGLMADVLVGQDGRALAIRLVSGSTLNSGRRLTQ